MKTKYSPSVKKMMLIRGITVMLLMASYGSLVDRASTVTFPGLHDILSVYMINVSMARCIINAEREKCIFYELDKSRDDA